MRRLVTRAARFQIVSGDEKAPTMPEGSSPVVDLRGAIGLDRISNGDVGAHDNDPHDNDPFDRDPGNFDRANFDRDNFDRDQP